MTNKAGAGWGRIILMLLAHAGLQIFVSLARPGWFFAPDKVLWMRLLVVVVSTGLVLGAWLFGRARSFEKGSWLGVTGVWLTLIIGTIVLWVNPWELVSVSEWLGPSSLEYQLHTSAYVGVQAVIFATFSCLGLFHVHAKMPQKLLSFAPTLIAIIALLFLMDIEPPAFVG